MGFWDSSARVLYASDVCRMRELVGWGSHIGESRGGWFGGGQFNEGGVFEVFRCWI